MFNLKLFKTMKAINVLCISALALALFSCSKDDDGDVKEEQKQDPKTKVVTWDKAFCNKIDVFIDEGGVFSNNNNSKDGISVTITAGDEEFDGFYEGKLFLTEGSVLTFTSTAGKFKKIEIYDDDPYDDPAVPANWKWNATSSTYSWQGTASATVTMAGIKDNLVGVGDIAKMVFTLE